MRSRTSKRRWKSRISLGRTIPMVVLEQFADLKRRAIVLRFNHYTYEAVIALRR